MATHQKRVIGANNNYQQQDESLDSERTVFTKQKCMLTVANDELGVDLIHI
jgi:hypothetical protein